MSTPKKLIAANTDNATIVKASYGRLTGLTIHNTAAAVRYVKIYDKATAPASTDTPVMVIGMPANAALVVALPGDGVEFQAGIGLRIVTGQADNDNTAPIAGDVVVNYQYR